jgi:hypothetical protein
MPTILGGAPVYEGCGANDILSLRPDGLARRNRGSDAGKRQIFSSTTN